MGVRIVVRAGARDVTHAGEGSLGYELEQNRIVIGRGSSADVRLPHTAISARHAVVEARGATYVLIDEGSTNGTSVNGTRLPPSRPKVLRDGDRIAVPAAGVFELTVQLGAPVSSPTTTEQTATLARRLVREVLGTSEERCPPPRVRFSDAGNEEEIVELAPGRTTIGRGEHNDIALSDEEASRDHAELTWEAGVVTLAAVAAKNEVLVQGEPLSSGSARRLRHGDAILIGSTRLSFEDPAELAVEAVARATDDPLEALPAKQTERTSVSEVAHTEQVEPAPLIAERTPELAPARRVKQPTSGADLVIYGLALVVLGLSIAGLVWLFAPT